MSNQQQLLAFLGADGKTTHTINTYLVANSWFRVACTLKISQTKEALIKQIKPWLVNTSMNMNQESNTCGESWRQRCVIPLCPTSSPVPHCFPHWRNPFLFRSLFHGESFYFMTPCSFLTIFSSKTTTLISAPSTQHWFCLHRDEGETWKAYQWILDFTTKDTHTHLISLDS